LIGGLTVSGEVGECGIQLGAVRPHEEQLRTEDDDEKDDDKHGRDEKGTAAHERGYDDSHDDNHQQKRRSYHRVTPLIGAA
jgi:hypothetical protein